MIYVFWIRISNFQLVASGFQSVDSQIVRHFVPDSFSQTMGIFHSEGAVQQAGAKMKP